MWPIGEPAGLPCLGIKARLAAIFNVIAVANLLRKTILKANVQDGIYFDTPTLFRGRCTLSRSSVHVTPSIGGAGKCQCTI